MCTELTPVCCVYRAATPSSSWTDTSPTKSSRCRWFQVSSAVSHSWSLGTPRLPQPSRQHMLWSVVLAHPTTVVSPTRSLLPRTWCLLTHCHYRERQLSSTITGLVCPPAPRPSSLVIARLRIRTLRVDSPWRLRFSSALLRRAAASRARAGSSISWDGTG